MITCPVPALWSDSAMKRAVVAGRICNVDLCSKLRLPVTRSLTTSIGAAFRCWASPPVDHLRQDQGRCPVGATWQNETADKSTADSSGARETCQAWLVLTRTSAVRARIYVVARLARWAEAVDQVPLLRHWPTSSQTQTHRWRSTRNGTEASDARTASEC